MKISRRALILGLSVVVIGLTLAGLQGILNILANRGPLDNNGSQEPVTINGKPIPTKTIASSTPKSAQEQSLEFPFDITQFSELASAVPSLNVPVEGGLLPHVPLFELSGGLGNSYLRSSAASFYQNGLWKYDNSKAATKYTGDKLDYAVEGYDRKSLSNITIRPLSRFSSVQMPIPTAQYVNKLNSDFGVSFDTKNRVFISGSGLPSAYSFESIKYVFSEEMLARAAIDQDVQAMDVPDEITARTLDLADEITQGIDSPYLKARTIEQYLEENYSYAYDYEPAPDNYEPNDWFLFEEKKGVCSNFNSAFVVLARASGIPARMVSGYAVDPQSQNQIVYADQAHAWSEIKLDEAGWVTLDATGTSQPTWISTTTEITQVTTVVEKNTPFTVQGTVTTETETVEGALVELYINQEKTIRNGTLIGQAIVTGGHFEIEAKVPEDRPVGNYQLIARSSQTPRYAESTSDPVIKVMAQTALSLASVPRIKVGQALSINGQLVETSKQILAGQNVEIVVNDQLLTSVTTDSKGRFEYKTIFTQAGQYDMTAQFEGSEFYFPSQQSSSFQVLIPTTLSIQPPAKIKAGQTLKLAGLLTASEDQQPIANQPIELFVDSQSTGVTAKTDSVGRFTLEHKLKNAGVHQIDAKYISQPFYWDSSARAAIEVLATNNKTVIGLLLMVTGAVIATGYVGLRYYRKHKPQFRLWKRKPAVSAPEVTDSPDKEVEPVKTEQKETTRLEIVFSGIIKPLPDVWGLGDDFDLSCELKDVNGQPLAGQEIEILMAASSITSLTTDGAGKSSVTLAFSEKGDFDIEAIYHPQNIADPIVQALRSIRIVDYREEIIEKYKSLLDWFRQKEINISEDNTPREAEKLILNSGLPVPPDAVESVIAKFEEATYSLHPISRQHYVKMHFAQEEIRENENTPE